MEEELLTAFYDAVNGKTKKGQFHCTCAGTGDSIIMDGIYKVMRNIKELHGEAGYRQIVTNVRDAIEGSEDTEAMKWWYRL